MNVLFVPFRASFLRWCSVPPRVPLQAHQAITPILWAPPGICRETHPLPTEGLQALSQVGFRQTPVRAVTGQCCFLQGNLEHPPGTELLGYPALHHPFFALSFCKLTSGDLRLIVGPQSWRPWLQGEEICSLVLSVRVFGETEAGPALLHDWRPHGLLLMFLRQVPSYGWSIRNLLLLQV